MFTIKELRDSMIDAITGIYPERECENIIQLLLSYVAGIDRREIAFEPGRIIGEELITRLFEKLEEVKNHKPVQYVTCRAYFYGMELAVNQSVLIPRPETEELVKWIADEQNGIPCPRVLDIGTGSGCIIIALGKLLLIPELSGIDNSGEALGIAYHNAESQYVIVNYIACNILAEKEWYKLGTYDIIVSNPPYVRLCEKKSMQPNVLDYEPHAALFVPDADPLLFYRAIAKFAKKHLFDGGKLYFEINENLGSEVVRLLEAFGFDEIVVKKDMQGKDRMVRCSWIFINH
jgi:release factor glutamine methyltransferase